MGNRQNCARFQENLLSSNEIISILLPSTFSQTAYTPYLELYQSHQILILQMLSITCIQNLNINLCSLQSKSTTMNLEPLTPMLSKAQATSTPKQSVMKPPGREEPIVIPEEYDPDKAVGK